MAFFGRIRRRLALALGLAALLPVLAAIWLAETTVRQSSARFFVPEIGERLDQSLGLYQELARTVKQAMRHEATAIAENAELRLAAYAGDRSAVERQLRASMRAHPQLVSLSVESETGQPLGLVRRDRPLDPEHEHQLMVTRAMHRLSLGPADVPDGSEPDVPDEAARGATRLDVPDDAARGATRLDVPDGEKPPLTLQAVFATNKARFTGLDGMSQFVDTYKQIEQRREADEATYVLAFSLLLGLTVVLAIGLGTLFARGVVQRLDALAYATQRVATGDLSVRVPERGEDELADLARAFNRMLGEVESSRARLEYLGRIGAWQEMARRLAHEIKNPLTPIQLAVQDIHRRYHGGDQEFRRLLDTTLEIVEDEVATLRRLVSEFSGFARLPQAQLEPGDLAQLLREQAERAELGDDDDDDGTRAPAGAHDLLSSAELRFEIPDEPASVMLDRQMMQRVLANLVTNAAQAVAGPEASSAGTADSPPSIVVRLKRDGEWFNLDVDDSGPGFPSELRDAVFDPYVTTKPDGTGLGLAIVKKIVVEHGGTVHATESLLGGGRVRIRLPAAGTAAAVAALEAHAFRPGVAGARANESARDDRAV